MNEIAVLENGAIQAAETKLRVAEKTFDLTQRRAKLLAASNIVPKHFQGNVADCVIAMELSERMGMPVLALMQSMGIIHGRPSMEGKFLKALVDHSGRFSPLDFDFEYNGKKEIVACTAKATELRDGKERAITVTWETVQAEGWNKSKQGFVSKWITHRQLMFMYRAASWFCKAYAPDLMMGMQSSEEMREMVATVHHNMQVAEVEETEPEPDKPEPAAQSNDNDKPDIYTEKAKPDEKPEAQATDAPKNVQWWLNGNHWQYRKTMDFYIACLIGWGCPFSFHSIEIDQEPVEIGKPEQEMYHHFAKNNPDSIGGLADLSEFEIAPIRKKFVFSLKIHETAWRKMQTGSMVDA